MDEVREEKEIYTYRAAGRSRKGGRNAVSAEYFCCVNFSGGDIRGIYGIADGMVGSHKPDAASELAVQIFRQEAERLVEKGGKTGREILQSCVNRTHEELRNKSGELEDGETFAASFVFCVVEENLAHIAYSGAGAAYFVEHGKISRLTEKFTPEDIDDPTPDGPRSGVIPAGWPGEGFSPAFLTQTAGPRSSFVFCSDGVYARVENISIQEMLLRGNTVEEGIDLILEEAHQRDASEDVTIVAVSFAPPREEGEAQYVEAIKYPAGTLLKKYAFVGALLIALAVLVLYFRGNGPGKDGADLSGSNRAHEISESGAGSENVDKSLISGPSGVVTVRTEPVGAAIFLDGLEEEQRTPAEISLVAGREYELRLEVEGYQPYLEKIKVEEGVTLERILTLEPMKPGNGSILVICKPECAGLSLDGINIKGFPRNEMLMREIPPGPHVLTAAVGDGLEERVIDVVSDITQSVLFRQKESPAGIFSSPGEGEAADSGGNKVDVVETPAVKSVPEKIVPKGIVRTAPVVIGGGGTVVRRVPEVRLPEKRSSGAQERPVEPVEPQKNDREEAQSEKAYLKVNTDVSACNIMVFENGRLAAVGISGSIIELEPGEYTVLSARAGYQDEEQLILLEAGETELDMQMRIRE